MYINFFNRFSDILIYALNYLVKSVVVTAINYNHEVLNIPMKERVIYFFIFLFKNTVHRV